jgi:hypothetical protein
LFVSYGVRDASEIAERLQGDLAGRGELGVLKPIARPRANP